MTRYNPITHVVFDMDGLLLDTENLYTIATQAVTSQYGKDYSYDIKEKCMGRSEREGSHIIIDSLQLPITVDEFIKMCKSHFAEVFPRAELLPGADKLVRHLHKHNVPIAIATGSNKWKYDLKTTNHKEFFSLFHHTVLISDDPEVHHGKPHPECFLVAAKRFDDSPSPEKVLVFEDSGNGVVSAHAAGMQCVWVPDPRTDTSQVANKATLIISSLGDFKPEEFGLPAYSS
ncbi:pseudouridine-5'-phosphatase-like [Liolophura sinensis]|uniref:pseudouridine-5'-phosphatase-like n=1 Tax=Liolophura sinensis TaxID=3198878 RepID=UPI0031596E38